MPTFGSVYAGVTSFLAGLLSIIPKVQLVAGQVAPFFSCVAFVLLVFGSMRGFLQNDTRHFFGNLLRVVILVCLIGNWPVIEGAINNAVNAFCNLQAGSGFFSTNGNTATTGRLNLSGLATLIQEKVAPGESGLQQIINLITHPLCLILYGIYGLALLLCEFIAAGMNVLQQCLIIFLDLYVPIGFAEFSIPSLRGQGEAFFKCYIGVQCWPIGWILANIVTTALLNVLTPPSPEDIGGLVLAIILCVPLLLWMVIGYVLAPFYVQKIVMRGGAELQAFAGAMIAAVGGTTGAVYAGGFALGRNATLGLNQMAGAMTRPLGKAASGSQSVNNAASNQGNNSNAPSGDGVDDLLGDFLPGYRESEETGGSNRGPAGGARNLAVLGITKVMDAGEFASRTAGKIASTVGALVADASSNHIGPERNFSFPQTRRNPRNRSSQRAADYLNQ